MQKILLCFFLSIFTVLAQDSTSVKYYPFRVDSIEIKGNKITDGDIITRELTFSTGDSIYYKDIKYNEERIFSLGIFNRVDLYTSNSDTVNILVIAVEESWYIYPLPFAELKDKSWNKISYGIDFYVKNFRGRNEFLRLRGAFGYDPSFVLNYTIPALTKDGNYYLFTDLLYQRQKNKSQFGFAAAGYNFNQKIISGTIGAGRRFGVFHRASISLGYKYVETPEYYYGVSVSRDRIDRYPDLGLNYIFDTRDLVQFPKNGMYVNTLINFKGWGINEINYGIANIDYRQYLPIAGDLYAKWRLAGRFGFGKLIPTADYSYLGFGERIRGSYSREMEGNNLYLASAEIFYHIIKDLHINLDFIPILPRELLHYRTGLILQFFTDTGTTRFRNQKISTSDFVSGYGIGLTFLILPYNILRTEFAVSENGTTEWIVDLGISF